MVSSIVFWAQLPSADVEAKLIPGASARKMAAAGRSRDPEIRTKCGSARTKYVRLGDLISALLLPASGEKVGMRGRLSSF